jgi:hypothetical protein
MYIFRGSYTYTKDFISQVLVTFNSYFHSSLFWHQSPKPSIRVDCTYTISFVLLASSV